MSYQIDDRIDRDSDEEISKKIEEELKEEYGVVVIRMDAFPDGFAAYKVKIDK
jgi:membrane-bound ClpP family serine protease